MTENPPPLAQLEEGSGVEAGHAELGDGDVGGGIHRHERDERPVVEFAVGELVEGRCVGQRPRDLVSERCRILRAKPMNFTVPAEKSFDPSHIRGELLLGTLRLLGLNLMVQQSYD